MFSHLVSFFPLPYIHLLSPILLPKHHKDLLPSLFNHQIQALKQPYFLQPSTIIRFKTSNNYTFTHIFNFEFKMSYTIGSVKLNMSRISADSTTSYDVLLLEAAEAKLSYFRDITSPVEFADLVEAELQRSCTLIDVEPEITFMDLARSLRMKISAGSLRKKISAESLRKRVSARSLMKRIGSIFFR